MSVLGGWALIYREQAWERWLNARANGCHDIKGFLLPMMRSIARSTDIKAMEDAIAILKNSEYWCEDRQSIITYFTKYWLDKKEVTLCNIMYFC